MGGVGSGVGIGVEVLINVSLISGYSTLLSNSRGLGLRGGLRSREQIEAPDWSILKCRILLLKLTLTAVIYVV